jgi:hypothetical protein
VFKKHDKEYKKHKTEPAEFWTDHYGYKPTPGNYSSDNSSSESFDISYGQSETKRPKRSEQQPADQKEYNFEEDFTTVVGGEMAAFS